MPNLNYAPPASFQSPKSVLKGQGCFLYLPNLDIEPNIQNIGISNVSKCIQIKTRLQNPGQETTTTSKAPNQDHFRQQKSRTMVYQRRMTMSLEY